MAERRAERHAERGLELKEEVLKTARMLGMLHA